MDTIKKEVEFKNSLGEKNIFECIYETSVLSSSGNDEYLDYEVESLIGVFIDDGIVNIVEGSFTHPKTGEIFTL